MPEPDREPDNWLPSDTVRWIVTYGLVNGFSAAHMDALQRLRDFVQQHEYRAMSGMYDGLDKIARENAAIGRDPNRMYNQEGEDMGPRLMPDD